MYLVSLDNNDETAGCFVTERDVKKIKRTRVPCVPSKTTRHARRVFERETRLAIDARVLCVRASATSHTAIHPHVRGASVCLFTTQTRFSKQREPVLDMRRLFLCTLLTYGDATKAIYLPLDGIFSYPLSLFRRHCLS